MKKIRLFALCGIIGCALLFIGTTTISKQKMEIGGFLANKYLPPDAYAASDAAIAAGAAAGHFVGGQCRYGNWMCFRACRRCCWLLRRAHSRQMGRGLIIETRHK